MTGKKNGVNPVFIEEKECILNEFTPGVIFVHGQILKGSFGEVVDWVE